VQACRSAAWSACPKSVEVRCWLRHVETCTCAILQKYSLENAYVNAIIVFKRGRNVRWLTSSRSVRRTSAPSSSTVVSDIIIHACNDWEGVKDNK
jgi:hypothetical protein